MSKKLELSYTFLKRKKYYVRQGLYEFYWQSLNDLKASYVE